MSVETLGTTPITAGRGHYRRAARRKRVLLFVLLALLVVSLLADLTIGPGKYPLSGVVAALLGQDGVSETLSIVVWEIRLPVAVMALSVGASLSVAGAQMQTVLNNPLASPFTLGISAAASFGAALAMVLGVNLVPSLTAFAIPANAFLMSLVAAGIIHVLSRSRGVSAETIVLLGIALVFTFNALLAALEYIASEQALAAVVFWTMGSLGKATWLKVAVTLAALACVMPIFMRQAWSLTALRLGEQKAESFGINVARLRLTTIILVSLLAALSVAFVGTIGFVGLVGPHIARMLIGEDQRFFLPASALAGALMLSAASVLGKSLIPGVILPIGVVTALVGVPFFFSLIMGTRRRSW